MIEDNDPVIDTFVGSFFHSDGTDGGWQGKVLEALGDKGTYYYVLTFSWLHGFEATRHIVSVHEMTKWTFYSCAENMRLNEPSIQKKWERVRKRRDSLYNFLDDVEATKVLDGKEVTAETLYAAYRHWVEL